MDKTVKVDSPFIKLDSFLKVAQVVCSGGEGKILILNGDVKVNGETETRRGRKLYPGDTVAVGANRFVVAG